MSYADVHVFMKTDMWYMVLIVQVLVRKGENGHVLCFKWQFRKLYKQFRQITVTVLEPVV